jgi:hypothetical protein
LQPEHEASIAAEEAQQLQQRRCSAEERVDDVKQMLTYFMRCRGRKRLEGELNTIRLQTNLQASLQIDDSELPLLTVMSCTLAFTYTQQHTALRWSPKTVNCADAVGEVCPKPNKTIA